MSRRTTDHLEAFDPEVERTLHQRQRELRDRIRRIREELGDDMEGIGENNP